ncbi:MAG: hypothetical protein Q8O55_01545 [Dehalococcoidales bacterium]|nr:hypothetical protein [Dehalococcoidales bacterium]
MKKRKATVAPVQTGSQITTGSPRPERVCSCGSRNWWYRKPRMLLDQFYDHGEWLCGSCHPDPNKELKKEVS